MTIERQIPGMLSARLDEDFFSVRFFLYAEVAIEFDPSANGSFVPMHAHLGKWWWDKFEPISE